MKKEIAAYLTVYLALTLGVLVSLSLVLIEGMRLNTIQLETAYIADIGTDSIMAEYHRELFRRYNLLAIDSSYGTKVASRINTEERLTYYLQQNMSGKTAEKLGFFADFFYKDFFAMQPAQASLTKVRILTDEKGEVFRREAVKVMEDEVGLSALEELKQWITIVESQQLNTRDVAAEKRTVDGQISTYQGREIQISEDEWIKLEVRNPTDGIEARRRSGIIGQIINQEVSAKAWRTDGLIAQRIKDGKINVGDLPPEAQSPLEEWGERVFFQEYLMKYFGNFRETKEGSALDYEVEYLIAGKNSDADNLGSVLLRLTALREAANALYIFSDKEKCGEADAVAWGFSTILMIPELQSLVRTSILFGWAYVESIYDLRELTSGKKIPLLKSEETWHYSLGNIWNDAWESNRENRSGLSYQDYLRIFLCLTDMEEMTGRAMNVVEGDVRLTPGNKNFRLDGCLLGFKTNIAVESGYGYRVEISTEKTY